MKRLAFAGALCCALANPLCADPLTDLFGPFFGGANYRRVARLHPSNSGLRHFRSIGSTERAAGGFSALASYYGGGEWLNAHTASGELFRPGGLTAAHRSLPLGTRLLVSHANRCVVVRINDRGPAAWTGRSLDLARGAAARLGMIGAGVTHVRVVVLN